MLSIGYQHPIIGLHMRGGDGCRYGVRARQFLCRSLADYVPQLRTMAIKYGELWSRRHREAPPLAALASLYPPASPRVPRHFPHDKSTTGAT